MGVEISQPSSQLLGTLVMAVLQMGRHRLRPPGAHRLISGKDRLAGRIALRRCGHIGGGLGEDDLGLRHPDPLHRLGSGHRHADRLGIRVPHILGSTDHDPPGNELHILPGVEHPGQVIDRRVRIGAPHALDERGDRVIVVIAVLIIADRPLLDALLGHLQIDVDLPVSGTLRGQKAQLHRI